MSENDYNKNRRLLPEHLFSEELELAESKTDCNSVMLISENNERLETLSQYPSTEEGNAFTGDGLSDNTPLLLAKDVMENIVNRLENTFSALDTRSQDSISSVHVNLQNSDLTKAECDDDILPKEEKNAACDQVKIDEQEDTDLNHQHKKEADDMVVADKEMIDESELNVEESTQSESWPLMYNFSSDSIAITGAWTEFKNVPSNFTKGCKWSPDGTCIVTNSEDHCLKIFNLPSEFYNRNQYTNWKEIPEMTAALKMQEGDTIYDYCWYPFMNSMDPATCCLASTSRGSPIHLFDAFTGSLLCSYRPYNNVDEVESAYSLTFDLEGRKLYSGFKNYIRIFDVNTPGRQIQDRNTKGHGLTGIISCICFNPANPNIYAAGSYLRSVSLFSEPDGTLLCLLQGQQGGITHMVFSLDGTKIFTGGRKDNEILCWDLRKCGDVLCVMQREVNTNQRILFDLDRSGRYIVSGSTNGEVLVWDILAPPGDSSDGEQLLKPVCKFQAHDDCVNGVSFHPTLPLVASSSGQRKYPDPVESDDSSSTDSDTELFTKKYIKEDNSLRLWWVGGELR